MTKEIYKIHDRDTGAVQSAYMRSYWTQVEFNSPEQARSSNCHGIFGDKAKYRIARYKVTYELIEEDVDPPTLEEIQQKLEYDEDMVEVRRQIEESGPKGALEQMGFMLRALHELRMKRIYNQLANEKEATEKEDKGS